MSGPRNLKLQEANEAIFERFRTLWGSTTPIAYDNSSYKPTVGTEWVGIQVRDVSSENHTMGQPGARLMRRNALVLIRVAVPANTGTQRANQLAQQAREIFEAQSFSYIDVMGAVSVRPVPDGGASGWYQIVVSVPVTYYQTY